MDGDYTYDDMLDETKGRAVRLFSLLTSYLRQRPLKLIWYVKKENGFEAWQILLKEMQPATRARPLALLSQVSKVQFADGKTISEQLPQFESIVNEYERISNQKYSEDAKVAAILLACPAQIRQHLHLWLTETTTYEQLKERIIQLEAVTTKWDSANSLMLPTRATSDEATPMEVDYVGKSYNKGKKGGKDKGKNGEVRAKRKERVKTTVALGRAMRRARHIARKVLARKKRPMRKAPRVASLVYVTRVERLDIMPKIVGRGSTRSKSG